MDTRVVSTDSDVTKEKLMQDLRVVMSDAEELLRATAGQAGDKIASARERIQGNLAAAKEHLVTAEQAVVAKTKLAAKATDEYVHENPWKSIGIVAGASLLIGMLISRSR